MFSFLEDISMSEDNYLDTFRPASSSLPPLRSVLGSNASDYAASAATFLASIASDHSADASVLRSIHYSLWWIEHYSVDQHIIHHEAMATILSRGGGRQSVYNPDKVSAALDHYLAMQEGGDSTSDNESDERTWISSLFEESDITSEQLSEKAPLLFTRHSDFIESLIHSHRDKVQKDKKRLRSEQARDAIESHYSCINQPLECSDEWRLFLHDPERRCCVLTFMMLSSVPKAIY